MCLTRGSAVDEASGKVVCGEEGQAWGHAGRALRPGEKGAGTGSQLG